MSANYYGAYYGNDQNQQTPVQQQTYNGYQPQSTQPLQGTSATQTNYHGYDQQQYAQHAYGSSGWYAANSNESSHGRTGAAEALSRLGDQTRSPGVRNSAIAPKYNRSATGNSACGTNVNAAVSTSYMAENSHATASNYPSTNYTGQNTHTSHTPYGQHQARPGSVTAMASAQRTTHSQSPVHATPTANQASRQSYGSQRPRSMVQAQAQQRSASPAQVQAAQNLQLVAASHGIGSGSNTQPTSKDTSHTALPNVNQVTQGTYSYTNQQPTASSSYAPSNTVQAYDQSTVTVNPSQVYDPWQEYQRKADLARASREKHEAERAALAAREAEQQERQEEEKRAADETRRLEEETRRQAEEQQLDEEQRAQAEQSKKKGTGGSKQKKKDGAPKTMASKAKQSAESTSSTSGIARIPGETDLEAEIRAMMAKMREYNAKNPQLLSQIWEQERQAHIASSTASGSTTQPAQQSKKTTESPKQTAKPTPKAGATPANTAKPMVSARGQADQPTSKAPPLKPPVFAQARTQSTPKPAGNTIWPQEKKGQLAIAATTWLNGIPENARKQMSRDEFCSVLDMNPTYIELCEKLEGQGLKLERGAFARALLTAVPDVNSASKKQQNQAASNAVTQNPQAQPVQAASVANQHKGSMPVRYDLTTPVPEERQSHGPDISDIQGIQRFDGGMWKPVKSGYQEPSNQIYDTPYFDGAGNALPSGSSVNGTTQAPAAPMVKEGSTSASVPSRQESKPPATKEEAARKRTFADLIDLTAESDDDEPARKRFQMNAQFAPQFAPPQDGAPPASMYQHNLGFNQPNIAFGNHPWPPAQQQYQRDPYPPGLHQHSRPPPPPPPVGDVSRLRNAEVIRPWNRKRALRRSTYDVRTIARDVLIATGKHPDIKPLNAHLDPLRAAFNSVDYNSDLSTFRWDMVDPGEAWFQDEEDSDSVIGDADDEEMRIAEARERQREAHKRHTIGGEDASTLIKKRKGRPFVHSSQRQPSHVPDAKRDASASTSKARAPGTPLSDNANPPKMSNSEGAPRTTSYSAFRQQLAADGTPLPKKRGRPVGWRKFPDGKPAGPSVASATAMAHRKRKGVDVSEPHYNVYRCKWKDCSAELHNLETLRKHVNKIHGKFAAHGGFDCLWGDCGTEVTETNKWTGQSSVKKQHLDFSSRHGWEEHVEEAHIGPMAWRLGDGPADGISGMSSGED